MKTTSRPIDHTCDKIVQNVYENCDNYIIKNTNPKSKVCLIFFSGNGLYYPNEENEFINKIIKKNRFEWENISSNKVFYRETGKNIFNKWTICPRQYTKRKIIMETS